MSVKNIARCAILLMSFTMISFVQAAAPVTAVGTWTVVDVVTKKPEVVVQITEDENHVLMGKIIKVYDPQKNKTMCTSCPEDFRNKPLVGMQILWGLKQASDYTWTDGSLLRPNLGRVFPCNLTMARDGQILTIRLYSSVGSVSTLGKIETWYRAS